VPAGRWASPAYAQDNFDVEPTKADSIGVEVNSAFTIKSKQVIDQDALSKNLKLVPEIPYTLQKVSDHEFAILPKEPLQANTVHRVYISSSYVNDQGITVDRPYSWAFQIKDIFKVLTTLPADKSPEVPLNTGIEITFSHDNVTNYEKNFSIEPLVKGRFEQKGRTVVFIPTEPLKPATIYSVKISKNISVVGSNETLDKDYVINFETAASGDNTNRPRQTGFIDSMVEFDARTAPAIPVFTDYYGSYSGSSDSSTPGTEQPARVFKFNSSQEFITELQRKETIPSWSDYNRSVYRVPTTSLTQVASFTGHIQRLGGMGYLTLPEKLPIGYYLVETEFDNKPSQVFLQITDLTTYVAVSETKTLLWVNNLQTGEVVKGATVTSQNKQVNVTTDNQGVAFFDSKSLFTTATDTYAYLLVQSGGASKVEEVQNNSFPEESSDHYWNYLYTDRQLYHNNDSIQLWGIVKPRSSATSTPREVTVELDKGGLTYNLQKFSLDELGNFSGTIPLSQATAGGYELSFKIGNELIARNYLQVENYTKPAYQIDVTANKRATFGDEKMHFDIKASFFEGTPVPNLALAYSLDDIKGTLTLDAQGQGNIDLIPDSVCTTTKRCYYPRTNSFVVTPINTEEAQITGSASVQIFGPRLMLTSHTTQSGHSTKISAQTNLIDLTAINTGKESLYGSAQGAIAPNVPVMVEVVEITYQKSVVGQVYDFINKRTVKQYDYKEERKPLPLISGMTDTAGIFEYTFLPDPSKSYEINIKAQDANGREVKTSEYVYSGQFGIYGLDDFYAVRLTPNTKNTFKIGEKVQAELSANGRTLQNRSGKFLFYRAQQGIKDFTIQKDSIYQFTFTEREIPSINIGAVWFDGHLYHVGNGWLGSTGSQAKYDPADKELKLEVTANKASYVPGGEVDLKVQVKDPAGKPLRTAVNLNLVDEAFYQLSYEVADPLGELYHPVSDNVYFTNYSHRYLNPVLGGGAEGGGCFLEGTKILMADGTEKNIQDVQVGDNIFTFKNEFSHELVPAKVGQTFRHIVDRYLVINNTLLVTPEHRIFVNGTWRQIGEAKVGDWLLDSHGNRIVIETIEERQSMVAVYNFMVEDYHTFIADGIYVHNDKGGGRQDFKDVALFKVIETDENGQAEVKFTLPDNITSWRVTSQAISPNLYAGVTTTQLSVSLPLFADVTIAKEYLITDKPILKTRAFGASLKTDTIVNFSVSTTLFSTSTVGKAFESQYLPLSNLRLGEQRVTITASTSQYYDTLTRTFNTIPSRVQTAVRKYYPLTEGLKPVGSATERTTLTFTDSGRGSVYNNLIELSYSNNDRIDNRIAKFLSAQARQNYFNEHKEVPEASVWLKYQTGNGGISLLPYSSSDLELSAKIAFAAPDQFDKIALKNYFSKILQKKDATKEEISEALLGLASLNEPVLLEIKSLAKAPDLKARERLYLAWAALALDDREFARNVYFDVLKQYAVESKPYIKINVGKNEEINTELSADAAAIGAALNVDYYHTALLNYVEQQKAFLSHFELERAIYATRLLPYLNSREAVFTTTINNQSKEYRIPSGGFIQLSVTPSELNSIIFSTISGDVVVISTYQESVKNVGPTTAPVSIRREYYLAGQKSTEFKETDLVEVRLYPNLASSTFPGRYQITDYVPSGLKIVSSNYIPSNSQGFPGRQCSRWYPYETDGQIVKYSIDKSWNTVQGMCPNIDYISYYARVVTPGTYIAEPSTIEHFTIDEVKNYSAADNIIITY
jgi:hypothetical protein